MGENASSETGANPRRPGQASSAAGFVRERLRAYLVRTAGYACIGASLLESMTGKAYAATIDITNINSILDALGNVILVVGLVIAGWNLVQVGSAFKDNQGFQMDKNVWGVIGGIFMAIAGGTIKGAGSLWNYGTVS